MICPTFSDLSRTLCAALGLWAVLPFGYATAEQTFDEPVLIDDNLCVGEGCPPGQTFSSAQQPLLLRDSSLSIYFEDTSSASFPSDDWRLLINDTNTIATGGQNKFVLDNITQGTSPLTVMGNAPDNALFVSDTGRIGIGTSLPLQPFHMVTPWSATLRLEKDGTSVGAAQIWQIQANDLDLQFQDSTNLQSPFRIEVGAPSSTLSLNQDGRVGVGTRTPEQKLHIRTTTANTDAFALFDAAAAGSDAAFLLRQNGSAPTTWEFRNQESSGRLNIGISGGNTPLKIDDGADNNLLKLGTNSNPSAVVVTGQLLVNNIALNVPDYVFDDDYALLTFPQVEKFIAQNGHLPGVPSAENVASQGLDLTGMQMAQLEKIEELTLRGIAQHKIITSQEARINRLEALVERLVENR